MSFIIFRSILIEIVIYTICIPFTYQTFGILPYRMIVHGSIRSIIHLIVPFVHSDSPGRITIGTGEFGGSEKLIDFSPVKARHAALHISFIRFQCTVYRFQVVTGRGIFLFHGHWSLVDIRAQGMIILQIDLPVQAIIPGVRVEQGQLVSFIQSGIIKIGLLQFTRTHVTVGHFARCRQIGTCSEAESRYFFHATVAYIDERGRSHFVAWPTAVAVVIDSRQLSASFIIILGQGCFIDLSTVLIRCKTQFETARIKILVNASTVEPSFPHTTADISIELLLAKVIGTIIDDSTKLFCSQLGERVYSITDIAGSNGGFGDFEQPDVPETAVSTPVRIYIMRIRGIDYGESVFEYIYVSTRQADRDFAGTIGARSVQHNITIAFFL